jgi:hypothetical protein
MAARCPDFARTGLAGYRSAAYKGVLFTALAWLGAAFCSGMIGNATLMYLGFGLVLLALFLQSKVKKKTPGPERIRMAAVHRQCSAAEQPEIIFTFFLLFLSKDIYHARTK